MRRMAYVNIKEKKLFDQSWLGTATKQNENISEKFNPLELQGI